MYKDNMMILYFFSWLLTVKNEVLGPADPSDLRLRFPGARRINEAARRVTRLGAGWTGLLCQSSGMAWGT